MKKFVSVLLVMLLALGCFAACGSKETQTPTTDEAETTPTTDEAETTPTTGEAPSGALEILENVWNLFGENEKFSVYGGNAKENFEDNTMDKPDVYDLADENISVNLLIPADQVANVVEVASMTHMMNANSFTAAAYHLAEGTDAQQFCETMYQAVSGNMWICGMPDRVIVAAISNEYVLVVYGVNDAINPFETHLGTAYPDAVIAYNESLV